MKKGYTGRSREHSLNRRGIKTAGNKNLLKNVKIKTYDTKYPLSIPYSDKVRFYANRDKRSIITIHKKHIAKGWYDVVVGDYKISSRNPNEDIRKLLNHYYPEYQEISLFSETSYHSGITQKGKIRNYGMKDYTLHYSDYEPIGKYKIEQPVRTNRSDMHGEIINNIEMQRWTYIVLKWTPVNDKIKLNIEHSVSTGFGDKDIKFKSKDYDETERKQAIKDFKDYVMKVKRS